MKSIIKAALLLLVVVSLTSCEKDEGIPPEISFKTGAAYTSENTSLAVGSQLLVGIEAKRTEDKDNLKMFNVSRSVNGGVSETVLNRQLSDSEGASFSYDFTETLEGESGQENLYTFTITNRDGITNQLTLKVTLE